MSGGDFEIQDVVVPDRAIPILNKSMLTSKAILMHFA